VSARVVLCKEIVAEPGYLVFYTNYESEKGLQIAANAQVAAVFHWDELGRQARIEGMAVRSPAEESDRYFQSRDRDSQIGAWTSAQSQPIATHADLLEKHAAMQARFGTTADAPAVPRPPHWGGFRLGIAALELWDRGAARLHDRARWERPLRLEDDGFSAGAWQAKRLQP
jgi:pyridoxamine 5'-phosphate oxidase